MTKKTETTKKKAPPKLQITIAVVKNLAFSCENMTDAAVRVKGNLVDRLTRSKALRGAWSRGRFLRDISSFASVAMTKAEVADRLNLPLGAFEQLLRDPEAADVWTRAQRDTLIQLKTGILTAAKAGKQAALKSFERILQEERPDGELDLYSLSIDQMCLIVGITRMTLHKWVTEDGLTRKGDKTFDLRVFIQWFEGFCQRKVNVTPLVTGPDAMKDIKTLTLKRDYDLERGKLIAREAVVKGYVGRLQQFLTLWDRLADGVADKCANMPKQGVAEMLAKLKDELRSEFCKVEIEMKLTEEQHDRLEKFLKELK